MHRAEQIVDALVALMPSTGAAFKHRVLTVSDDEKELPAQSVRLGEDRPFDEDGASNFAFIDSLLFIEIDLLVKEVDIEAAITRLMQLRTATHVAIMADRSLGLSFVIDTRYGGSDSPEADVKDYVVGSLTTRWQVHYRMNIGDPS
jgi:hypothetical protein